MTIRQLALAAGAAALLLALLTAAVAGGLPVLTHGEHAVGAAALRFTRAHALLRSFLDADAAVQEPVVVRVLLGGGVIGLLLARRWWYAGWLLTVLITSTVLAGIAKQPLARARPTWHHPVAVARGYSYPSGHATAGWVLATVVVLLAVALLPASRTRRLVVVLALASAVVVSLDRVFLGVHYPSDVVAGALAGCLLALLPWLGLAALRKGRDLTGRPTVTVGPIEEEGRGAGRSARGRPVDPAAAA